MNCQNDKPFCEPRRRFTQNLIETYICEAGQIKVGFVFGKFASIHTCTLTYKHDCKPVNWMTNNQCECHVQQSVSHLK